jgi:AcrR family transcriptional regulator
MARTLTREESKLITRRRLLEAAAKILRESGSSKLSASAVAREAGIAQPTFYVHFKDKDDLLQTLAREKIDAMRRPLKEARLALARGEGGLEALQRTFRLPLEALLEHPELFRLYVQQFHDPGSVFGAQARELHRELEADLVEDLVSVGVPSKTASDRERLEMMATGMIALTQTLALGYVDGRFSDLDAIVEVLTRFALGAVSPLPAT